MARRVSLVLLAGVLRRNTQAIVLFFRIAFPYVFIDSLLAPSKIVAPLFVDRGHIDRVVTKRHHPHAFAIGRIHDSSLVFPLWVRKRKQACITN